MAASLIVVFVVTRNFARFLQYSFQAEAVLGCFVEIHLFGAIVARCYD